MLVLNQRARSSERFVTNISKDLIQKRSTESGPSQWKAGHHGIPPLRESSDLLLARHHAGKALANGFNCLSTAFPTLPLFDRAFVAFLPYHNPWTPVHIYHDIAARPAVSSGQQVCQEHASAFSLSPFSHHRRSIRPVTLRIIMQTGRHMAQ